MGLLKTLFGTNPEKHEQKGDACVMASDWGMAKLAYEAALDALEKKGAGDEESRARILKKLQKSMEALAREHMGSAEDLIESGYGEDARELLELALDLARDGELRRDIQGRLERLKAPVSREDEPDSHESWPEPLFEDEEEEDVEESDDETFIALCGALPEEVRTQYLSYGPAFRAGYLALNRGDFAFAADALSAAMEENPSPDSFIPLELATALLHLKRLDAAIHYLEAFRARHPEALPGYQVLCEVLWEKGDFVRAEEILQSCPEDFKESLAYVLLRGEGMVQGGRPSEAAAFYEAFTRDYGAHDDVLKALAACYETLEKPEKARELYFEIMNRCQACNTRVDPQVRRKIADISFDLGEHTASVLESYLTLAQEDPANRPLYFQRISEVYGSMGNEEEARRFRGFARQAREGSQ